MSIDIRTYGAVGDGKTLNTEAIQNAIDEASRQHTAVVIAGGVYLSGALFLKPDMKLEIQRGGTLLGSPDLSDYPIRSTRYEGRITEWPLALLNAVGVSGLEVYGGGILDGNGYSYWERFWKEREIAIKTGRPFVNRDVMRPRLCFFERCNQLVIEDLTLQNSAFWHLHLYLSSNVSIKRLLIQAPHEGVRAASSDAIDIDACSNVTISDCNFSTDDDCIAVKGGKGPDAHLANPPTENIVVEQCRFGFGHGVITLGSEASIVKNVVVRNCEINGENTLLRCKFRPDTYQKFENIYFENLVITDGGWLFDIRPWISRQDEVFGDGLPSILSNVVIRNITATNMQSPGVLGKGCSGLTIDRVQLEQIDFSSRENATGRLIRADKIERQEAEPGILAFELSSDITFTEVIINGKNFGQS